MGNSLNLLILLVLQQALCPAVTNVVIVYIIPSTTLLKVTDDLSLEMLN